MKYLFGDTDLAAKRLQVLADVFTVSSRPFLKSINIDNKCLALDLGCGPGFTTRLLWEVFRFDRYVGLDNSEHFLTLAQKQKIKNTSFYFHDITRIPFPIGPADLIYCRFLLTHLKDTEKVIANWSTQLAPKGKLLIEEVEWINTDNPYFTEYLKIVNSMLERQSNKLYVGPIIEQIKSIQRFKKIKSKINNLKVTTHHASTMFSLNMKSWKEEPFIRDTYSKSRIQELEEALIGLSQNNGEDSDIEWGLRQVVFKKN